MMIRRQEYSVLLGFSILLSSCSTQNAVQQSNTQPGVLPSAIGVSTNFDIGFSDNGKSFSFNITSRFSIILDDTLYPVNELSCTPERIIGQISDGSVRGPGLYPVMFEGVKSGSCTLSDRDFQVEIVIK
jgi:hypothetical protein